LYIYIVITNIIFIVASDLRLQFLLLSINRLECHHTLFQKPLDNRYDVKRFAIEIFNLLGRI